MAGCSRYQREGKAGKMRSVLSHTCPFKNLKEIRKEVGPLERGDANTKK